MEKGYSFIKIKITITANGSIIKHMDMVSTNTIKAWDIKVNGIMIYKMDPANNSGSIEHYSKENSKKDIKYMENSNGQTDPHI